MKNKTLLNFGVGDESWQIILLSKSAYIEKFGKETVAMCDTSEQTISFNIEEYTEEILAHELMHAYISLLMLNDCNHIHIADFEELICNIMGKYVYVYYNNYNKLRAQISKYMKRKKI